MKRTTLFIGLCIVHVGLFLVDLCGGTIWVSPVEFFTSDDTIFTNILWSLRLPKSLTAIIAGAILAVCGLLMQTLFRNPLAGPYILGVSSGASLGVALLTMCGTVFGISLVSSPLTISIVAIIGALIVMGIVLFVARKVVSNVSLLIVGMMLGSIVGALVNVVQNFANPDSLKLFIVWSFGSLTNVGWTELLYLVSILVICAIALLFLLKPLNGLLLGEELATSLGVNIRSTRYAVIIITCVLTGVITAFCGPIAFIGVAVPHLVRGLFRTTDHRCLVPACALLGAVLLLLCDTINSLLTYPLPISTLSALIGAPVIVWVIIQH